MENTIESLKKQKGIAYKELRNLTGMLKGIEETYLELKSQCNEAKELYESIDHQLALIDGRLKKIEPSKKSIKSDLERDIDEIENDLTEEQIERILARRGITLPEVEDEEEEV